MPTPSCNQKGTTNGKILPPRKVLLMKSLMPTIQLVKTMKIRYLLAAQSLASAEKSILNPDYRESLDNLNLEYGVDALIWNSESKIVANKPCDQANPASKFSWIHLQMNQSFPKKI